MSKDVDTEGNLNDEEDFYEEDKEYVEKVNKTNADVLNKTFREFCGSTSIHGVQYLGEAGRPLYERALWFTVLFISIFFASKSIWKVYDNWITHPVVISFEEKSTPVNRIPFPAVTICPVRKIKLDKFQFMEDITEIDGVPQLTDEQWSLIEALAQIEDVKDEFKNQDRRYVQNYTSILKDIAIPFKDIRYDEISSDKLSGARAIWKFFDKFTNRMDMIITEAGICYTHNFFDLHLLLREETIHSDFVWNERLRTSYVAWDPERGYSFPFTNHDQEYPKRKAKGGMESNTEWVLKLDNSSLEKTFVERFLSDGFLIMIHSPIDYPQIGNLVPLGLGEVYSVYVKPIQRTMSDELRAYTPETRKCYMTGEKYLRFFRYYTQKNCELECLHNYTLPECGCVPYYLPRSQSTPVCNMANTTENNCTENADRIFRKTEWKNKICDCKIACYSVQYDIEISQTPHTDPRGNILRVFFKEDTFWSYRRSELFSMSDFFSSCGGVLSLFLGMSVLSVIEILYHFTVRLCRS